MVNTDGYWDKFWRRRASRRTLLRSGVLGTAGLAAAIALGCENEEKKPTTPEATPMAAATLEPEYANAKRGGILTMDSDDEPANLEPYTTEHPASVRVQQITYNCLLRRWEQAQDPDKFGLIYTGPELASKWEQVDQTTYRFSLVQNAKWHNLPPVNGRQFTSADIKYSFERMIDPKKLDLRTRSALEAIDRIETPDNFTAVFKLKYPFAPFLANASHGWSVIVPRELAETEEIKQRAVGTYFILKEWQRGVRVVWDRNPEYFRTGHPFVDKIVIRYVPDRAARLANFRTGETDWWGGTPPEVPIQAFDDVRKDLGDKVRYNEYKTQTAVVAKVAFDTANQPFKDIRLRHAFLYGIPYDTIIGFLGGYASRSGPLPPGNREWALKPEELPAPDVEKAKALLAEAGYGPDKPLKVKNTIPPVYNSPAISQVVQALIKPLGIEIENQVMEMGEWLVKIYRGTQPFQMTITPDMSYEDPDRSLYTYFHSKGVQNPAHYTTPEIDQMLEAQRREFDLAKRKDLVKRIQLKIVNDAPFVWIGTNGNISLTYTWLKGYHHMVMGNSNSNSQWDNVWYDPTPPGRA